MKQEDVTIIIPTLYTELSSRALKFCLESLGKTFTGRILVVINGKEAEHDWQFVGMDSMSIKKQGQCHSTNEAVKEAETEWIMIVNDDMYFPPNWFKKFTDVVENFNLLVASPNLVEPRKGAPPFIEKFCGGIGTMDGPPDFNKQCFLDFVKGYKEHENRPESTIEDGFNLPLLIRKDVWDTVGGYDENYDPFSSNSDSDLQYKFMLAGVTPKRIRSVLVYHFSQTSGTFHPDNASYVEKNHKYFTDKWGFNRASSPEVWYKPTIDYNKLQYKPIWRDKYGETK